jgi:type IV secretory pathway VirB2 component (pilin)
MQLLGAAPQRMQCVYSCMPRRLCRTQSVVSTTRAVPAGEIPAWVCVQLLGRSATVLAVAGIVYTSGWLWSGCAHSQLCPVVCTLVTFAVLGRFGSVQHLSGADVL